MSAEQNRHIFDYSNEQMSEFRLCVDRFGDQVKEIYRLYCPYVIGYWEFESIEAMVKSLSETDAYMQRSESPNKIFTAERGVRAMTLAFSNDVWRDNMLHIKQGSYYSAYIYFWLEHDAATTGTVTLLSDEKHSILHSETFSNSDELMHILINVEEIYSMARTTQERRRLFQKYRLQKRNDDTAAGTRENTP